MPVAARSDAICEAGRSVIVPDHPAPKGIATTASTAAATKAPASHTRGERAKARRGARLSMTLGYGSGASDPGSSASLEVEAATD